MNSKKSKAKKIVAGVLGLALALSFVVGAAASPAQAATVEELTAQINSLLSTIASLQSQLSSMQGGSGASMSHTFTVDLTIGSKGADVTALQQILVSKGYLTIPAGVAYGYFGKLTQAAVAAWQKSAGISPAVGYFGPKSRAAFNAMAMGPGTTPTTPPPAGSGLSVSAATQPPPQLAPEGAARVPFTKFTLTAGSSDVTVNSITVTRVGPSHDAVFSGVLLLDENGIQIGTAKTLNSNHQANIGEPFTVKAGTSRTLTVAGNMLTGSTALDAYAGEVPAFAVSAINTSAAVSGSLPITGTAQTINATLALGTANLYVSSYDPNVASTQNIGTSGFRFAGIRVTAGSAEDVRLWSIRWNQSGSASSGDLANVMTVVDGVKYPATISADGKYYTTSFGTGIVIAKGFSKDVYVTGDIVGSGSANRTVQFDIYKNTDIYLSGETYGYGITPTPGGNTASAATTASEFVTSDGTTSGTAQTPWYSGSAITIAAGSVTTVTNATSVAAQNVAENVPNVPLGGFTTDIKGEPISVQSMIFRFTYSSGYSSSRLLTSVRLIDDNGAVVAGPVDATDNGGNQKVTFTDTVTFPVAKKTYTLQGKLPSVTALNGVSITASTTPSSDWTNITGQTTGNTISLTGVGLVTMNAMTIRTAALAVAASPSPAAQNIIAGTTGLTFTNLQFDASQSGEDVRFSQVPMTLTAGNGTYTTISGCQLYDGSTALNTGSNVINPTAAHAGAETFTLDTSLTVPKGTVKTVAVKCNVASNAAGTFHWDMTSGDVGTDWATAVTGVTSSQTVTPTGTAIGATMTIGTASLATSNDASTPGYTLASAGASGVTLGVIKFRATNDDINLQRIGLILTNTASSSRSDLAQVTLWNGSTQVGTATFTSDTTHATSTLTTPVSLPKDTDVQITVKADLNSIGSSAAVTQSGHLVTVDIDNNTNTYGTGVGSGTTVNATGSTSLTGVRVFKSTPTLAQDSLSGSGAADGRMLRFKITAGSAGPVSVAKFAFTVATTSATYTNSQVTAVNVFGYTDSAYSQPISGVNTGGQFMSANQTLTYGAANGTVTIVPQTTAGATTTIQVPAGQTRYFEVRGTVAGQGTSWSVTSTLNGDSAYLSAPPLLVNCDYDSSTIAPTCNSTSGQASSSDSAFMASSTALVANSVSGRNANFVWSPNSTTTPGISDVDWTNGYGLLGLPASGIIQTRTN